MDLLTRNADKLVELKSGKADEYPYRSPKDEHRLQMALYKEILYYNLDRRHEQVQSYLFYSRYPGLYAVDVPRSHIRRVMALRNAILHIEHRLRKGESRALIGELTEERLNVDGRGRSALHSLPAPPHDGNTDTTSWHEGRGSRLFPSLPDVYRPRTIPRQSRGRPGGLAGRVLRNMVLRH